MNSPLILLFFAVGLLIYATIVFWAGKRAFWWLAILLSLPAAIGGAMWLFVVDIPPEASMFARFSGWLVLVQAAVGMIAYRAGHAKRAAAIRNTQE